MPVSHKIFIVQSLFVCTFTFIAQTVNSQAGTDSVLLKMVNGKRIWFVPQSTNSSTANLSNLAPEYKFKITPDSVVAYLPYFGKSYTPQHGRSDDEMIQFTSTDFKFDAVAKKKGRYDITVLPKESKGIRFFLTIFSDGQADMEVTNPRKETVLFRGYVK